ncbi:MAG: lipoyl(octanoyl) transferase LipB [Pseudomonadota bacterium]
MTEKHLGLTDYESVWHDMRSFVDNRASDSVDQVWITEHKPVFTQGTSCADVPDKQARHIPVVKTDRGGQITYHGPGQLIIYPLLDIKRLGLGPKRLVAMLQQVVIDALSEWGIRSHVKAGAPGVYVNDKKIAALGLRIRRGCCYHGLSFNHSVDLAPFSWIDPCGYPDQAVSRLVDMTGTVSKVDCLTVLLRQLNRIIAESESTPQHL